jgi:amino acid transporter
MPLRLRKTLGWGDGLALVVGIMVGSGIFRTPGLVASSLGRPALTFVAWALGGAVGLLGALVFAELSTRHPHAGGKYVYARESFGRRAAFVVGWIEALTYCAAVAAIAVGLRRLPVSPRGWPPRAPRRVGVVAHRRRHRGSSGRSPARDDGPESRDRGQGPGALGVLVVAAFAGSGAGWTGSLPGAPTGTALLGAMAVRSRR